MSTLAPLRIARWFRRSSNPPEYPHLEALIEQESAKVTDGYHYARWIVPLVGAGLALACFLPPALTVHPLFWIGSAGMVALGCTLGYVFHRLAKGISSAQILLRKRCLALSQKLVSLRNLIGVSPTVSPKVAKLLDGAAQVYLTTKAPEGRSRAAENGVWEVATRKARLAMEEGMAELLTLAEPETPQAQEIELSRGWAQPLLVEMRETARLLDQQARRAHLAAQLDATLSPLAGLADARAQLEQLDSAASELDRQVSNEQT